MEEAIGGWKWAGKAGRGWECARVARSGEEKVGGSRKGGGGESGPDGRMEPVRVGKRIGKGLTQQPKGDFVAGFG